MCDLGAGGDIVRVGGEPEVLGTRPFDGSANIRTGSGNDSVHCGSGLQTVETGDGDDYVSFFGNTFVFTEAGNDTVAFVRSGYLGGAINMGEGNDSVYVDEPPLGQGVPIVTRAGPGDDYFALGEFGGPFWFPYFGGPGIDTLDAFGRRTTEVLDLTDYPDTENVINISGPIFPGLAVIGNELPNLLSAENGSVAVTLVGGGGNDTLIGWDNSDSLDGGDGDDLIFAPQSNTSTPSGDVINGGAGNDTIYGGSMGKTPSPGRSFDQINAGPGDDLIYTADGDRDTIDGGPGRDFAQVDGGRGGDVVSNVEKIDARPVRVPDFRFVFAETRVVADVLR